MWPIEDHFVPEFVDPKLVQSIIVMGTAGLSAYYNACLGTQTPAQKAYAKRSRDYQPGDLVVELSSFSLRVARNNFPEVCVGTFVEQRSEWVPYDLGDEDKIGLDPDELGFRETAYYILPWVFPYPSRPFRWVNCDFVAVPRTPGEGRDWEKSDVEPKGHKIPPAMHPSQEYL